MRKKFYQHFEENEAVWLEGTITASERRVLDACWLSESVKDFYAEGGQEKVTAAFQRCGMLNAIDGSEDHLIRVPGIENYDIGESDDESEDSESESSDSESDGFMSDSESESDSDSNSDSDSDSDSGSASGSDSESDGNGTGENDSEDNEEDSE